MSLGVFVMSVISLDALAVRLIEIHVRRRSVCEIFQCRLGPVSNHWGRFKEVIDVWGCV